jgi:hypothetical protein
MGNARRSRRSMTRARIMSSRGRSEMRSGARTASPLAARLGSGHRAVTVGDAMPSRRPALGTPNPDCLQPAPSRHDGNVATAESSDRVGGLPRLPKGKTIKPAGAPFAFRFSPYVERLERLARDGYEASPAELAAHLDGEAGRQLRQAVGIDELRELGAFFTGEVLASKLVNLTPMSPGRYLDPACGCGDLLLAASARLEIERSLKETLIKWNERLVGRDLVPEFVRVARSRLVLAALNRGARRGAGDSDPVECLSNIAVGDGRLLESRATDVVLLNPPYGRVVAPLSCTWTSGLTTEAALFADAVLSRASPGARLAAVLPEVLRAGTRYARFRGELERKLAISAVTVVGPFDALTDVDVFMLSGTVGAVEGREPATWVLRVGGPRLSDVSNVSVGSLVAYRDPEEGALHPFIDARNRGSLREVKPSGERRFRGRAVRPPFVVIARTNAPTHREGARVRPTIVRGSRAVAVENHLLVIDPHDKTLRGCRALARALESQATTEFLDERLRCRHLTVEAVREIPL